MWPRKVLYAALAVLTLAAFCACASAARLVWDANTEPHLRGYKIHYGSASGQYTETVDVGNVTEWPIPDEWPRDRNYYFAATAYAECVNAQGQTYTCESGYSNEAIYLADAQPPAAATDVRVTWRDLGGPTMTVEVISTTEVIWASGADPAGQSITIPNDCTAVYMFWTYFSTSASNVGLSSVTLNGNAPDQSFGDSVSDGRTGEMASGVAVWYNPATGSRTLDVKWTHTPAEGPICTVAFVKGGNLTAWRDAGFGANIGWNKTATATIDHENSDLVLSFIQQYGNAVSAPSGWTSKGTAANKGEYGNLVQANDPSTLGTPTISYTGGYPTIVAISIPLAAGAATSLPPSILSRQRDAFHHMIIR